MKSVPTTEEQFNAIVEEYGSFLRQTVRRVCPKDLGLLDDEIEQEARLRLWRALESEREIRDTASYLYRIAVNATLDAIRRIRRRREEQIDSGDDPDQTPFTPHALAADPSSAPDREAERRQVSGKVRAAMARLSDHRRTAVGLHLEGLTTREIANLLGWSESKARNLVYRGLSDLRLYLKEMGIGHGAL